MRHAVTVGLAFAAGVAGGWAVRPAPETLSITGVQLAQTEGGGCRELRVVSVADADTPAATDHGGLPPGGWTVALRGLGRPVRLVCVPE
jgi:hypothetical protein